VKTLDEYTKALKVDQLMNETDVLDLAARRELDAANADLGVITAFKDPALNQIAARLAANEASPFALLRFDLKRSLPRASAFGGLTVRRVCRCMRAGTTGHLCRRGNIMNARMIAALVTASMARASTGHAAGDAGCGEELYENPCVACHSVQESRVGPAARGVFVRRAGGVAGCDYSDGLCASKVVWYEWTLAARLTSLQSTIPGQKRGYQVSDAVDRADLIACLHMVSSS